MPAKKFPTQAQIAAGRKAKNMARRNMEKAYDNPDSLQRPEPKKETVGQNKA